MICLNCGRKLRSAVSKDVGYGPVCYRQLFGVTLPNRCKDKISRGTDRLCDDIPGQMTMEEYLQMYLK